MVNKSLPGKHQQDKTMKTLNELRKARNNSCNNISNNNEINNCWRKYLSNKIRNNSSIIDLYSIGKCYNKNNILLNKKVLLQDYWILDCPKNQLQDR